MASEHLNLPPVPSVARIIQPANEDTAPFILQSVLKTGAHLPAGKWSSLAQLLWDSAPNPGPIYCVFREWTATGRSRNIKLLVEALLRNYGELDTIENPTHPPSRPWLGASAARRQLQLSRSASVVMPTLVACRRALLKTTIRRACLACSQKVQASMHRMYVARLPCASKSSRMHAQFWPRTRGPPTRNSVLVWCRAVILSAPAYHRSSLITGQTIIPPTWPLAQLSPRSIAPPSPT